MQKTYFPAYLIALCMGFFTLTASLRAQVVITEVSTTGEVELKNLGTEMVDISTYWLCNFPAYDLISDLTFVCGSATLLPGQIAAVKAQTVPVNAADGEMGLYTSNAFSSAAALIDYVEWGSAGHRRASLAISNGIWPAAAFVPAFSTGQSISTAINASTPGDWSAAASSICSAGSDVRLVDHPTLGEILADADSNTLYYYTRDARKDTSFCNGGCAANWPIFYKEAPVLGGGLDSVDFGTITRADGSKQTTYKGWPLYYYVRDTLVGQTNGQAVGNVWFVAKPDYGILLMDNNLVGLNGITYNSQYQPGVERVQYFVDAEGRTIYVFIRDNFNKNNYTRSDFSNDPVWPIYGEELGSIPTTLDRNLFDTINVFGRRQLTYNGWPLYYYGPDSTRGQTLGVSVPRPGVWPVAVKGLKPAATVVLANNASRGQILTDAQGKTLYYFTRDAKPDTSFCSGGCAATWPIFYAATLSLGAGLDSADFSAFARPDGSMQTTYKGWPLYYYVQDTVAGQTSGEGVGNRWFVAKPDYTVMLMDNILVGRDGITYTGAYVPGTEQVKYFVDPYGRTLYFFVRDSLNNNNFTRPDFSNNGVWPIYEDTLRRVPSTIVDSLFGSIDVFGRKQLTYKGWPMYYYGLDSLTRGKTLGVSVPTPGIWPVAIPGVDFAPTITAVKEIFQDQLAYLSLSPVPADDFVQIKLGSKITGRMTGVVYNLRGQAMKQFNLDIQNGLNQKDIDISNMAPGMYLMVLHLDGQVAAYEKFVKN